MASGGLDFELPAQNITSPSRSSASGAAGLGVAVDVERLSLVNNAPGNVFTGTALAIHQPIPTQSINSSGPDQIIRDVAWYSAAPGQGGSSAQGQAWNIGIEITEAPFTHIDHVTGTQWGSGSSGALGLSFGPTTSAGIHIVSTGPTGDYFQQQVWITNYAQQGAYRGIGVDGHNLQGLYVSGAFLLQNSKSIDWEAPSGDASASFTLTNSSIDGQLAGIYLNNVRQVMINNTEILNGGTSGFTGGKLSANYYGIFAGNTDDLMVTNNVLIPVCSTCTLSQVDSSHKGYGIWLTHGAVYDGQASVISSNSIDYGDVGVAAGGGQILVDNNSISTGVPTPTQDTSGGSGPLLHPTFSNTQYGALLYSTTTGSQTFNGSTLFSGITTFQTQGASAVNITAVDTSQDAYVDLGNHSRSSINLTGATNNTQAIGLSALNTSDGALTWFTGATEATSRWGIFYADQTNGLFHESFPAISFDIAGTAAAGTLTSAGLTLKGAVIESTTTTPASSSAACVVGQHAWDASYEYRCVALNTWKRAALGAF